uniref:GLUG motif-containing protein n=1 Tax=Dysosmobacter welbionis TaxID=2093857 RepID=UPI003FEE4E61
MRRKIHKCLSFLLAAVLLASLAAPAALAAEGGDTVFVRTAEDLVQLAENCTLDSWSQGRIVRLEADIDLSGTDFTPIPTFGGTFEGQGHTISGLSITGSGNVRGLFRYIQPSGVVRDLSVEGRVDPSDRKNTLGGIAGSNRGLLAGCTFHGTVRGADSIGGLVGINESSGQIVNCTFSGAVTGEHYAGGIAGQNYGAVIQCRNSGSINTTEVDAELDLDAINREQLNAAENVPVCTDIGGVAGYSSGIIQSCTNSGSVGYDHVGYNIGGIVGRQSGYLDGCANSGDILGRKDVGGVAGQLEPEVRLLYDQGQMGELLDALDGLGDLLDQTQQDLRGTSDALSDRMDAISARTDEAREAVGDLADSAADWTNENIEELNSLTARISWLIDQLAPILDDAVDVMDLVEDLADELGNALDEVGAASGLGDQAEQELRAAVQSLRRAASSGKEAVARLLSALEHLGAALGSALQSQEAMEEVRAAAGDLAAALGDMSDTLAEIARILWNGGDEAALGEAAQALADTLARAGDALEQAANAVAAHMDSGELEEAGKDAAAAWQALGEAAQALRAAAGHATDAAALLAKLLAQGGDLAEAFRDPGRTLEKVASRASRLGEDLADVFWELAEEPTITIRPIDSAIREQGDALGDVFAGLLEDGDALRETMSAATDTLLDDLEAIGDQFRVITDLLRDLLEQTGEELSDRFEDISDQETSGPDTGCVANSRNTGTVEGDINVAGIVGSMAIEYDFDPEDDLIEEGDRSLDFRYQTKAVVRACMNRGGVTGKRDYAGGVVGLMDLGRVSACENYGDIASTDGGYVGGIAGASWGTIRDSWVKCHLSGGDYIGGVAGLGATLENCHTLVEIEEGSAYLGAVAGDVDADAAVSDNTFTSERLGALDGISYAGHAEPVDFDTLCTTPGVPESFSRLELTFVADGVVVEVVPFQYGEGIDALPEIPAKKGCSASWPDLDYTYLTASQTLEAEYTPYTSALTDGGELPEILVDGSFSSRAQVSHTTEEVAWTDGGAEYAGTAYTVTVEDPDLEQAAYTVHCRLPDPGKRYDLWVLSEDGWTKTDARLDGQYLLLESQTGTVTFCLTERAGPLAVVILAVGFAGLLIGFCWLIRWRRKGTAAGRKH